mgnify:FL=1
MKSFKVRSDGRGVSLIALVITIIVIIILAAIAFNSSTSTIGKADYSKFVSNLGEVQDAITTKATEFKGDLIAKGVQITDDQAYNYVAKGGKTEDDVLSKSRIPDYTIIEKTADIGIKLPIMKVNTPTRSKVEVTYAVTKDGNVFIWPPFENEGTYSIRDKETVDKSLVEAEGEIKISVAGKELTIESDVNGKIVGIEILEDGLTKKEFEKIANKLSVGQYVNYQPTSGIVSTLPSKTGTTSQQLTTDQSTKWRILNIDESTGKIMLTTDGYVNNVAIKGVTGFLNGASELNRLCEKMYSNIDKGIIARSMTIEDLDKVCEYISSTELLRYAWYPSDTAEADLKDVVAGGHVYTAKKHQAALVNGVGHPRFYNWDDKNGVTHQSTSETDYIELKSKDQPVLITQILCWYRPSNSNAIIGDILKGDAENNGWLASQYVSLHFEPASVQYGLFTCYASSNDYHNLFSSYGGIATSSSGLRPVVSVSAKLLDVNDTSTNGLSASTAWNIK